MPDDKHGPVQNVFFCLIQIQLHIYEQTYSQSAQISKNKIAIL